MILALSVKLLFVEKTDEAFVGFPTQQEQKLTQAIDTVHLLNPIQARGGTLCPPHLYHSISPKRLGVWSYCLVNFLSMYIPLRKVQFHQSALMYVAMATKQFFGLFLKTQISIIFQVFPPERNFL